MAKCFVIQPFDNDVFDKRYDEVIAPAVSSVADLEPYRVDRDPKTKIVYQDIQDGIKDSLLCLADITTDNPNVWFELGYALATDKEIVMICAEGRDKFPFDIQHRHIIHYKTSSPSDFDALRGQIVDKIKASIDRVNIHRTIEDISATKTTDGFSPHEVTAFAVVIAESLVDEEGPSAYQIADEMEKAGFNKVATSLSLKSLVNKELIAVFEVRDMDGGRYHVYRLTDKGENWALRNQGELSLNITKRKS